MSDYYSKLSEKDKTAYNKLVTAGQLARMERDPKYKREILARAKKATKQEILRKLKSKGHMTHGSKYGKLKSGLSINGKNR